MDFAEHATISGLYVNLYFPEVQIHKGITGYYVTHHGVTVSEAGSLFDAIKSAKRYVVQGEPPLENA